MKEHLELCILNILGEKPKIAMRMEESNLSGVSISVIMTVIVAAITSYAVLDCLLRKFLKIENANIVSASKRQKTTLFFCSVLYLAGGISLFWKRFEVNYQKNFFEKFVMTTNCGKSAENTLFYSNF